MQVVDGQEKPVMFWSRSLNTAERNYATTDREALAVVACLKKFRHFLWGLKFEIHTDHQALIFIFIDPEPRGRQARWVMTLKEFDFTVKYRKGAENVVADCLSRNELLRSIKHEHYFDAHMVQVFDYLNTLNLPEELSDYEQTKLMRESRRFFIHEGELYRRKVGKRPLRVVISLEERRRLIKQAHDGLSHFGVRTTYEFLNGEYFWPNLFNDVKAVVMSCDACQKFSKSKGSKISAGIGVSELFERIGIDYVGPLPETKSKKRYMIVAIEYLTGWPIVKAVKRADAVTTAKFIF